ncbi:MAG: DUF4440 domain-containing protein [Bacteroidota bacterium]
MKKYILIFLVFVSCTHMKDNTELLKQQVMKTDQDFSQMSSEKGMKAAFLFYVDNDVVLMREGNEPLFGKAEMISNFKKFSDSSFIMTWQPVKAEASGDLGYTFGKWQSKEKATRAIETGTYVTIWKKQPDGTWKYVLDGGSTIKKAK